MRKLFAQVRSVHLLSYFGVFLLCSFFSTTPLAWSTADRVFDVLRNTHSRNEVAIVGIDDTSLEKYGAWPWNRAVFGDVVNQLNKLGARAIVFDVLFFEQREGDNAFSVSLEKTTIPIILASKVEDGSYRASFLNSGSSPLVVSALANVDPDSDGKVRNYPKKQITQEGCVLSLSEKAFTLYTKEIKEECSQTKEQFRYSEHIPVYSLADVVQGGIEKEKLQGKVIFIGSTSLGLEDHFVGIHGDKVPGVYVHASAFTSLLNDVHDTHVPPTASFILLGLYALLSVASIYRIRKLFLQLIVLTLLVISTVVLSVLCFEQGITLPLPALLMTIVLVSSYATLARFIDERRHSMVIENLFSKYVHKDVLQEILASGKDITLGGERKELSILFSDIRGFTTLSESLSPENLTKVLNEYFSAMTPHILEEKGTIDKFIGDAIMAFWNAPLTVEHHATHAVRSALRMQKALELFNEDHATTLAIGIGVHTGACVVGNVGGKDRVNYTILGDSVNLASRLEGLTKKYGISILVTEATKMLIQDNSIVFRFLDEITVAGKALPTKLYQAFWKEDVDMNLIHDYEEALDYYRQGAWGDAETRFTSLEQKGDLPSAKMLARIPELRTKTTWDGVWRFDEK
ncbi:MAG: hypothetical protein RIQ41_226 [Candidatus Parcubacteria bacterium]|jgi:adenylate cyclase